jgi:hypothetical membrane protein
VSRFRATHALLAAAVAMPVLYYATLWGASLTWPEYSHVTRYASELGSAAAPRPWLFNTGIVLTGLLAVLGGLGYYLRLRQLGAGKALPIATSAMLVLFGVSMVLGGLFPMPDPRHGGFGLGLGIHLAPVLLLVAIRRQPELRGLRIFLVLATLLLATMFAIMMGVGGLVTLDNVGLFQRTYSLTLFPWIGIAAWYLLRSAPAAGLR